MLQAMDLSEDIYTPHKPRSLEEYELLNRLGQGGQGVVWKARIRETGEIVALKVITSPQPLTQQQINFTVTELEALEKISTPLCHPFLACYYTHYFDLRRNMILIQMEYIEGKDVDSWVLSYHQKRNYDPLAFNLLLLIGDLARALEFIHSKGVIHRDIKGANIMISDKNVPKLIDFGLSCQSFICPLPNINSKCCQGNPGTPIYMPPETIKSGISYFASDVWSLGVTIYYLITQGFPFDFPNNNLDSVLETIKNDMPKTLQTRNDKLNRIVNGALIKNPLKRITVSQILQILRE